MKRWHLEFLLPLLFIGVACFLSIHLLYSSYISSSDLAIFVEMIKNTIRGLPMYSTIQGVNQLAVHFSPILFLIVPFYWIAPHAQTLLVIQAVVVGAAGYVVFTLAKQFKLSYTWSLFIELLFFINPLVWGIILFDFHEACFTPLMILIMLLGLVKVQSRERGGKWLFVLGLILATLVMEDAIFTIGVLGLCLISFTWVKEKRLDGVGIIITSSAIVMAIVAVTVSASLSPNHFPLILSFFTGGAERYTSMSLIKEIKNFISSYPLILAYLLPLGLLPLWSIKWTIPAFCILAMDMASTFAGQHSMLIQYSAPAIPYLFLATITAISYKKDAEFFVAIACGLSIVILLSPISKTNTLTPPNTKTTALTEIISTIPNNVSVTANNWVVSHLVDRDRAYTPPGWYETIWTNLQLSAYSTPPEFDTGTGFPAQDTEYVLTTTATYSNGWDTDIQSMLPKEYNLIAEKDGTELWQLK